MYKSIKNNGLGTIPKGWENAPFEYFIERGAQKFDCQKSSDALDCIELEHIQEGSGRIVGKTSTLNQKSVKNVFRIGDVVFGKLRPYLRKYFYANFDGVASSETWVLRFKKQKGDNLFLFYLIQTDDFIDKCNRTTGTKMPRADWEHLSNDYFLFPPLPEQQKIATILSTWDKAIGTTEKLIAAKEQLKKGLIQQLLTGKKKLKGFKGEWSTKELGKIGEIAGAGVDKKISPNQVQVRLLNYLDVFNRDFIYSKELHHEVTAPFNQAARCSIKKGDIFFTPSSEMPYDIAISAIAMEDIPDAAYSYHIIRLRLFEDWDLRFRAYIFKTMFFTKQAETFCEGSGTRYVISLSKFREMKVYYPISKEEQAAIANILWAADQDILLLKTKLTALKQQKKGLMQVLLTGRVRVKMKSSAV